MGEKGEIEPKVEIENKVVECKKCHAVIGIWLFVKGPDGKPHKNFVSANSTCSCSKGK